jgi:hypothetical protein
MVRALVFACVYSLFVYISSPTNNLYGGTVVCIMRASAASVWVLGAALPLLLFALPQCGIAIWARLRIDEDDAAHMPLFSMGKSNGASPALKYNALATRTPPPEPRDHDALDEEMAAEPHLNGATHVHVGALTPAQVESPPSSATNTSMGTLSNPLSRNLGPLSFKPVVGGTHPAPTQPSANVPSKERMAQIAASMVADESTS